MTIWVDADACPVAARDILCKAARRVQLPVVFVANHFIKLIPSPYISLLQVASGFDEADNEIVKRCVAGDLVVTSDIPLAADVIPKKVSVFNHRGERFTENNIGARLNMRDFMDTMRASGERTGGSPAYSAQDKQAFANRLDQYLARQSKDK